MSFTNEQVYNKYHCNSNKLLLLIIPLVALPLHISLQTKFFPLPYQGDKLSPGPSSQLQAGCGWIRAATTPPPQSLWPAWAAERLWQASHPAGSAPATLPRHGQASAQTKHLFAPGVTGGQATSSRGPFPASPQPCPESLRVPATAGCQRPIYLRLGNRTRLFTVCMGMSQYQKINTSELFCFFSFSAE